MHPLEAQPKEEGRGREKREGGIIVVE